MRYKKGNHGYFIYKLKIKTAYLTGLRNKENVLIDTEVQKYLANYWTN